MTPGHVRQHPHSCSWRGLRLTRQPSYLDNVGERMTTLPVDHRTPPLCELKCDLDDDSVLRRSTSIRSRIRPSAASRSQLQQSDLYQEKLLRESFASAATAADSMALRASGASMRRPRSRYSVFAFAIASATTSSEWAKSSGLRCMASRAASRACCVRNRASCSRACARSPGRMSSGPLLFGRFHSLYDCRPDSQDVAGCSRNPRASARILSSACWAASLSARKRASTRATKAVVSATINARSSMVNRRPSNPGIVAPCSVACSWPDSFAKHPEPTTRTAPV